MRQTSFKTVSIAAALVFAISFGITNTAFADGGIGGRVAHPDPKNSRSNSIFIYELKPGQSKFDQIEVINNSDKKQTILIGSVDGVPANNGSYACRAESDPAPGSGSWVKLSRSEVTLDAGKSKNVDFRLDVPQKVDVGEHNSCITLQAANQQSDSDASGLTITMRQAVRMVVTVPGQLKRDLSITSLKVDTTKTSPSYEMTVKNSGNVSAYVKMSIVLQSFFGKTVSEVSGEYPVLPDVSLTQNFTTEFRPMFGGVFKAAPSISYDKRLGIYGAENSTEKFDTKTGQTVQVVLTPTVAGWLIIIGTIFAVAGIVWWLVSRYKNRKTLTASLVGYKVKPGDTLQSLAESCGVSWREIARINKIAAPYTLESGDMIKLPSRDTSK